MKETTVLIICALLNFISSASIAQERSDTWSETKITKSGSITVYWYDSNPFIFFGNDNQIQGIEYEILQNFSLYLKSKYGIQLQIDWIHGKDFTDTYNRVKNSPKLSSFGLSGFSITEKRSQEVSFSIPYMDDIAVLITSNDVPIVSHERNFKATFEPLQSISIANTTYVDYLQDLQSSHNLKSHIEFIPSSKNIGDEISNRLHSYAYIDLPNYLIGLKNGHISTRQNLYAVREKGYAVVFPEKSDWKEVMNEYFLSPEFTPLTKNIITKYLGTDVHDLMNNVASGQTEQIILLTREKEIQDQALIESTLKIQRQTTLRNLLILGVIFALIISIVLYRGYSLKAKSNRMLSEQRNKILDQQEKIKSKNIELEEHNQKLSSLNNELQQLNTEKNDLINILSHDLRSPLNNIKGLTNVYQIENKDLTKDQLKVINIIGNESDRLNKMIGKILDLEAIEAHRSNINFERVNLSSVLSIITENFSTALNSKNLRVTKKFDEALHILGDQLYITLVFENLISNAVKYSEPGKAIELSIHMHENRVRSIVTDHGPGLNKEDYKIMFNKFQTLNHKTTSGEKSYGLGLSIVKKYVEEMNGTVWCESDTGAGASFFVEFDQFSEV